jgi:hypothetical protein
MAIVCTPSALIGTNPCLHCLSNKQLWAIIMYALATANSRTISEALANSACFKCLGDEKDFLISLVTIFADRYLTDISVPDIIEAIKCLECAPEKQIKSALLYELCAYYTR